jgi:thiol-disulfide isomerase/thioredoxin
MKKYYLNKLLLSLAFSIPLFATTNAQEIFTECTVKAIASSKKPTVIMVYGNYCGACKKAKKDLPTIIKSCKQADFHLCNVQDSITMGYLKKHKIITESVNSIPLFIIRNKGKHAKTEVGHPGQQKLITSINNEIK